MKKAIFGGKSPKKGGLDSLQIQEGAWQKKGVMSLRGVWDSNAHYELEEPSY